MNFDKSRRKRNRLVVFLV